MMQYRFYVGLNQQDGKPVTEQQKKDVIDRLLDSYTGITMYASAGLWTEDGERHREDTIVFETVVIVADTLPNPADVAQDLAGMANQKSVLYTGVRLLDSGFTS